MLKIFRRFALSYLRRMCCLQVEREIESLTEHCKHRIGTLCVYGGVAYNKQERQLRDGVDMVRGPTEEQSLQWRERG